MDDNIIDIAVNTKLLQIAKISDYIYSYSSAQLFIDFIESDKYDPSSPNVLLLDIMMPTLSGFQCLEKLTEMPKEITKNLKVFMVSSSIDRNDISKANSFDIVEKVLEKPLDVYLLKKYLTEIYR